MEARAQFRSARVSRSFTAFVVALVALAFVVIGAYAASSLAASGAGVQTTVHPAAGTVLRQDNPVQTQVYPAAGTILRQDNPAQSSESSQLADSSADTCLFINHHKAC
jgi:hypothetical protein